MKRLAVEVKPEDWGAIWALEFEHDSAEHATTLFFEEGQDGLLATSPGALLMPVAR